MSSNNELSRSPESRNPGFLPSVLKGILPRAADMIGSLEEWPGCGGESEEREEALQPLYAQVVSAESTDPSQDTALGS